MQWSTMQHKLKKANSSATQAPVDNRAALTPAQEAEIVEAVCRHGDWAQSLSKMAIGFRVMELIKRVPGYAQTETAKKWLREGRISKRWLDNFMKRHAAQLSRRVVDVLEPQRERLRESEVLAYFSKVQDLLQQHPNTLMYNLDETGIMALDKKIPVYVRKGAKKTHSKGNNCRFSLTCLMTIS